MGHWGRESPQESEWRAVGVAVMTGGVFNGGSRGWVTKALQGGLGDILGRWLADDVQQNGNPLSECGWHRRIRRHRAATLQ